MLKILSEKVLRTDAEIEELYKDCRYICIIDSLDKVADDSGYLYCVSTSADSFDELIHERTRLQNSGKYCYIGGGYKNGGMPGVQYLFEPICNWRY